MMSGRTLVSVLLGCLLLPTFLFPFVLKLPRLVEFEIVVGAWWLVWSVVLTTLLYKGWHISDDISLAKMRAEQKRSWWDYLEFADLAEGLPGLIVSIIVSVLAALLLPILVELVFPVFAWLAYSIVLKMLRTAAHDRHHCEKNLVRSARYGIMWASFYLLPVIAITLILHITLKQGS